MLSRFKLGLEAIRLKSILCIAGPFDQPEVDLIRLQ